MMRALLFLLLAVSVHGQPLRLGIIGLTHDHVRGFFRTALTRSDLTIVGISDPDAAVRAKYAASHKLDASRLFASHAEMLDKTKPEAVMVFTSTFEHREAVALCAARKIHVMMEKPLAVSREHARAMAQAAKAAGIHVMVNYETTWYPVNTPIWQNVKVDRKLGEIRRIVTHYGHQGPKEINVGPEFFTWLTDPVKNGAGALFDFGCYGANFATWLFENERPQTVYATTRTNKPAIYPKVDDEATIVVQYPKAQVIVQPSWNWPYSRKDMEVYGTTGFIITANPRDYRLRTGDMRQERAETAPPLGSSDDDVIHYLTSVVRNGRKPDGLTGLENNLIVTDILEAARESARSGRAVRLNP